MAQIDTSTIAGYADMTVEQKLAALEGLNLPEPDYSGYVRKDLFDRTSSELAEAKKKARSASEESSKEKSAMESKVAQMEQELAKLTKERTVSDYNARLLGLSFDAKTAEKAASALADGDTDALFTAIKEHMTAHDAAAQLERLKQTPTPPAGSPSGKSDYMAMAQKAMASGDMSGAAYYMRLAQQGVNTNNG